MFLIVIQSVRGSEGESSHRENPSNPTDKQRIGRGHAQKGHLGAAAGAAPKRTTCIRGIPGVCDPRVIGGVVRHAAVIRIARPRTSLSVAGRNGPEPHGGTVIPPEGFRSGGASVAHWAYWPAPVSARGSAARLGLGLGLYLLLLCT